MERSDKQKIEDYVYTLKCYSETFSSPSGQVVLQHIMQATGVFNPHMMDTPGLMELRNFGVQILEFAGMQRGDVVPDVIKGIVLKATDTDPDKLWASVEEYLRSSGEIS